jgi:hypothetical protein
MPNSITPPPHLLKKFSTEARDESNKRNGTGYLKTFAKLCIEWANSKSTSNDRQIRSSEITPPPDKIHNWLQLEKTDCTLGQIITIAAQWGADQELEACVNWLDREGWSGESRHLRAARRPKPPSLKEQAQIELDRLIALIPSEGALAMAEPIRRALEDLDD